MPFVILLLPVVLCLLIGSFLLQDNSRFAFIPFFILFLVICWSSTSLIIFCEQKDWSVVSGVYSAREVDGVDIVVVDDVIINLNKVLGQDIKEGATIHRLVWPDVVGGISWRLNHNVTYKVVKDE